jgi:small-conductance mechanosensitive channel
MRNPTRGTWILLALLALPPSSLAQTIPTASELATATRTDPPLTAAGRTPGVRSRPEPFVLQRALSDFYVEYELRFHVTRPEERVQILSALHGAIQDGFNEARVQIMSPHFEMQPNAPVLAVGSSATPSRDASSS